MTRWKGALLALAAWMPQAVLGQGAVNLPMSVQPLIHERGGTVHGCGLRVTGGEASAAGASSWFDVSVNLFRRDIGIAQSTAYEIRRSELNGDSRPVRVPVQSTWITASSGPTRLGESVERGDTLIYRLLIDDVLALFEAVATAQPVTLGVRRWGQRAEVVYSGIVMLSTESRLRIANCLERFSTEGAAN
ncbi:MAG: hypothetical protein ACXWUH_02655 [Burkholderiales bacterium]